MSAASEYAELLKLIEVSGPFLSLPVFKETFPQGLVKDSPVLTREMKELYEQWRVARSSSQGLVSPAQREWLGAVFETLLGWPAEWIAQDNAIPQNLAHTVAQHHETLRPDAVLFDAGKPRLLISILAPNQQPDRRPASTTWNASCATRMAELLHATRIPVGLVTNGERFTLVYAEPGQPTGFADFRAELWFDERLTLRAFRDFLSADALYNRPPEQAIEGLYRRSLDNQQEVSITLGRQVRRAVEMFVSALDRADRESDRTLLKGVHEEHVYEAALFLMMRLVFLFFAEERDLLPMTNAVYRENYAVSTLHDQLREAADRLGEEVLERRYDAFPRLLATFRAVHGGVEHDLAALPAYGGDLFDPDRFPFLEGRTAGTNWHNAAAQPCPIHNRTVLHLLQALQFLEIKVPGGWEKRRLSFRALDIEQIGHVYEGLLDHTVRRATEIVLSLEGKEASDIALSELERQSEQPRFVDWLADETGRTAKAIEKSLRGTSVNDPLRWPDWEQVKRFAPLVRRDDNGDPGITSAGGLYVTAGTARRQTGTQYTPRTLTESVVEHALAPQVYVGPAEGKPPEKWVLKPAGQILDLKICDFACGSAAFLVAAARYLSSRLLEAWEKAQKQHGAGISITPYGDPSLGLAGEELIPSNSDERGLYALRIVVERCLYGVDRNPLAVEMAKLSLWLLTLQRNRPFTFLDHAIRCGDSLLGVDLKQLSTWSLSGDGKQSVLFNDDLAFAADKREGLMKMQYHPRDQQRLLDAAQAKTRRLRAVADLLIATAFEPNPDALAGAVTMGLDSQEAEAKKVLADKRPFHWPIEFPEAFLNRGGFDAIVGNPPFMGGSKLETVLGRDYRAFLVSRIAEGNTGVRGSADLCTYFLLRAERLLASSGAMGLIVTNSLAQGDAREVGFGQILRRGGKIIRANPSSPWPGHATVYFAMVWITSGNWNGDYWIENERVPGIDSSLNSSELTGNAPFRLAANEGIAFEGAKLSGEGFVVPKDWAENLIRLDSRYRQALKPYLTGAVLNGSVEMKPESYVITFYDWPLSRASEPSGYSGPVAEDFPACLDRVKEKVLPGREGLPLSTPWNRKLNEYWWQFGQWRWALDTAMASLDTVIVLSRVTPHVMVERVDKSWVFSDRLTVFATDSRLVFAILQSLFHDLWAWRHGTTNLSLLSYSPSSCFLTLPLPASPSAELITSAEKVASEIMDLRRRLAHSYGVGLTEIYNRIHEPSERSVGIQDLRDLHHTLGTAVALTYGWQDLDLEHGFRKTKQGIRYTISTSSRLKLLDRLLALNHERHAQEQMAVESGLKPKHKARKRSAAQPALF